MTTALASYSRSGTTWVRYCVEYVTGRPADSEQYDKPGWDLGVTGEPIITKVRTLTRKWDRAVWLIRHPYDAILSYHEFRMNEYGDNPDWERFVVNEAGKWRKINDYWHGFPDKILIRFEDMKTVDELRRILAFLGADASDDKLREAVEKAKPSNIQEVFPSWYFSRAEPGHGIKKMSMASRDKCREIMNPLARGLGYDL